MKRCNFFTASGNGIEETVEYKGIPFRIKRQDGVVLPIGYGKDISINKSCKALFFLGMTTDNPRCSEWWEQNERYSDNTKRLFIGDRIGRINIIYDDESMETIPVIFGVNAWPYELFTEMKEYEAHLNVFGGPYRGPFDSDSRAATLLRESMILTENDAEKSMKYILGIRLRGKTVKSVSISKESYKEAGFIVSGITGLLSGNSTDMKLRLVDPDFFLRQEYFPAADRLARRLYQYKDEMPVSVPVAAPKGYKGPSVRFAGNGYADIFTNVYYYNLNDMRIGKVDEDGMSHTSSLDAPNYGNYVGFGTCRTDRSPYYKYMWARDIGRILLELVENGESSRTVRAADVVQKYLYDPCIKYKLPHWKRCINSFEHADDRVNVNGVMTAIPGYVAGKENDGHGSVMTFIYSTYLHGFIDKEWLENNRRALEDAVGWIQWQIENPLESNFDRVLYSESEASTQVHGGYDLFSNACIYYGLKGYEKLAEALSDDSLAEKCKGYADTLRKGILERFTAAHPRYGRIFSDTTDDVWTYEYKRFAPLFLLPDIDTYDPALYAPEFCDIARNTFKAQKEEYFCHAAGRQMGYGQGYLTQTCILLDEYMDMTGCIELAAAFCYHHSDFNYIVPEGVIMHPTGKAWFRNSDLGNGVQQAEIVKCARLLIGLDDLDPAGGLRIIPRLPDGWSTIEVDQYSIIAIAGEKKKNIPVSLKYERLPDGFGINFSSPEKIRINHIRFGPFVDTERNFQIEGFSKSFETRFIGENYFVYVSLQIETDRIRLTVRQI